MKTLFRHALSIISLIVFFIVGTVLLLRVNEEEGMRMAQEESQGAGDVP